MDGVVIAKNLRPFALAGFWIEDDILGIVGQKLTGSLAVSNSHSSFLNC
jgi:hypothetical protein